MLSSLPCVFIEIILNLLVCLKSENRRIQGGMFIGNPEQHLVSSISLVFQMAFSTGRSLPAFQFP